MEQSAFNMFKTPSTDEYKRHVIESVKAMIDSSPRITVNKLKGQMQTKYFVSAEDVDGALAALVNVYVCVSSYTLPKREVTHLNSKQSDLWVPTSSHELRTG